MAEAIPTICIRIVEKRTGLTGNVVLGSATIPENKIGQITLREVAANTPDTWFAICDRSGTVNTIYAATAGMPSPLSKDIEKPIESVDAGSVRVRVLNATPAGSYACNVRIDLV